jgi:hypothetical protein
MFGIWIHRIEADEMNEEMVQKWVTDILDRRMFKSWNPLLFADPPTVSMMPTINGMAVQPDPKLPTHMLVIRCEEAWSDEAHGISCIAGEDMAHLHWGKR